MNKPPLRPLLGIAQKYVLTGVVMLGLLAALVASRKVSVAADASVGAAAAPAADAAPARNAGQNAAAQPRIIEATWQDLSGAKYGQTEFAQHQATVLFFLSSKCPCSDTFVPAITTLASAYADKGVKFFTVFSNGDESMGDIRGYLASRKLNVAAVRDEGGKLSATLKSVVTPSAVILDSKRALLYQGAIGDFPEKEGAAIDPRHLVNALTKVLAGERPALADRVRALGCAIVGAVTAGMPAIETNDNRQLAGRLVNGRFVVRLVAETGLWRPEKADGAGLPMYAFREEGKSLQAPGPLIRVPAGTEMVVTIKNTIGGEPLEVHGLNDGNEAATDVVRLAEGEEREFRWKATQAVTKLYWATVGKSVLGMPHAYDALLSGGLIVDRPGARPDPAERVFVLQELLEPAPDFSPPESFSNLRTVFAMNGLSWPYTERLKYDLGENVRWRIINGTFGAHPMHLHGFHFEVLGRNDGKQQTHFREGEREMAVTERVAPGGSVEIGWTPTEVGRWIYHCHMLAHFSPNSRVRPPGTGPKAGSEHERHALEDMSGFVLGIEVHQGSRPVVKKEKGPARQITVHVREHPTQSRLRRVFSYTPVEGANAPAPAELMTPSRPLVLVRGQRTQITVVNHLKESTAIHWHGIELESVSDGVVGWGGHASSVTPSVAPGGSFVAEMTPPRAGTFIYHTHFEDAIQLRGGLFGALIVLEPGETFDPEKERVFVISSGLGNREGLRLNGSPTPADMELKAGQTYRFRLINISNNNNGAGFRLSSGEQVASWRAIAKDGAKLPPALVKVKPAQQVVTVGETRDFEYTPDKPGQLSLTLFNEGRTGITDDGRGATRMALNVR